MTAFEPLRGVIAPNLTPFNDDLSVAMDLYVAHGKALLDGPCVALAPFGTTGEALSVASDERIAVIESLIDAGADPKRLVPGTGLTNLPETVRLSQACLDMGCAAVMTLPPFYFKGVSDNGLYTYFAELIARIDRASCRIFLYHIPQVAGVGIPPAVAARLRRDFPNEIVGIKDSSGDWENTKALLDIDGLIVYPGSELPLFEAMARGAPGCISATANLNGAAIAEVISLIAHGEMETAKAPFEQVRNVRMTFQHYAPIPAQKRLLAVATGDRRWANVRPPLEAMDEAAGRSLAHDLGPAFVDQIA
ncbi:MAG: dihydrodipicolinate synthase family protein [Pseudomonadota bacterium]